MQSSTLQPSPGVAYCRMMTIIIVLCDYGLISPGVRAAGTFRETKLSFRPSVAVTPAPREGQSSTSSQKGASLKVKHRGELGGR